MPIKSILRGIPLLFGSKEVAVELEYPPKSFKTQWPTTFLVSHIYMCSWTSLSELTFLYPSITSRVAGKTTGAG